MNECDYSLNDDNMNPDEMRNSSSSEKRNLKRKTDSTSESRTAKFQRCSSSCSSRSSFEGRGHSNTSKTELLINRSSGKYKEREKQDDHFLGRSSGSHWKNRLPNSMRTDRYRNGRSIVTNEFGKKPPYNKYHRPNQWTNRDTGRGFYRGKNKAYFAIDPRMKDTTILDELANQSPGEVLLILTEPQNGFSDFIQNTAMSNETIASLLKLIVKGFTSEMHQESLNRLMAMILGSNYIQLHIPVFVSSLLTSRLDLNSTYSDLLSMYETLLHRMPTIASETLNPSIMLCANTLETLIRNGHKIDGKHNERLVSIQKNVKEVIENTNEQKMKERRGRSLDDRPPPNNFRYLPIIPTRDEIVTTGKPFLRKNIIDGSYDDAEHYLDVQFRLMREDFNAPLRLGICDYLKEHSRRKNQRKFQDVRVYEKVRVNKVIYNRGNLFYELSFNKTHFTRIKWEKSRRLIFGSLLCLSPDNFQTVLFASVVNREVDKLKQGLIEVKLETENGEISCMTKRETQLTYIMAESPAFFEAYRHVLLSLKMMNPVNMPFQDYIVHMKTEHTPPNYLKENPVCDLSFMLKTWDNPGMKASMYPYTPTYCPVSPSYCPNSPSYCPNDSPAYSPTFSDCSYSDVASDEDNNAHEDISRESSPLLEYLQTDIITTDLSTWPNAEALGLDESQRKAMKLALSSSVAVIQGPPGTGKTYVGLKIVEALLRNNPDVTPILVVCFTNHALDQFLEGILSFTTELVRVGGRSENEALKPYNLKIKRYDSESSDLSSRRQYLESYLRRCQNNLSSYKEDMKSVNDFILHENALHDIPQPDEAIVKRMKDFYTSFNFWRPDSVLASWLGLTPDKFVNEYELQEFFVQEEAFTREPVETKIEGENEKKEEEVCDAVESDDDVIDVEDEASAETKNRMLDNDYDFAEEYEIAGIAAERSDCWALNIDRINDLYFMYNLGIYRHVHLKDLLSLKDSDSNVQSVLWLRKNFRKEQHYFDMLKIIAKRELVLTDSMDDSEITEELNVWELSLRDKWRLYRRWLKFFQEKRKREIEGLQEKCIKLGKRLNEIRNHQEYRVLKNCKIIGMTTTGAAKYQPILYEIGCKIVIIEEAAEVLETHIISTLNPKTEHLILIGDHLQLRPKPTVFYLAKKFNLDVSLFERLIKNGLRYETLQLQHRMRPEISRLIISHIYPSLLNHPSVHEYPHVRGMKNDIFFISHSEMEQEVGEIKSHENKFEAEYLVGLCHYLLQQGYEPERITILTMYTGQVFAFRKLMPKTIYQGVRVAAVDNYQGEENDVILLSLVRSNEEGKVGFVNIENRINVALSRARHGLYVIGNFQFLADNSDLWKRLMADLQMNHLIGKSLKIGCRNHPESHAYISNGTEFQQYAPEGGCVKNCDVQLPCGHICPRVCHLDDHDKCTQRCAKQCPEGHPCPLRCYKKCEPCMKNVKKTLPCGHTAEMKCFKKPEDCEPCEEIVRKNLPCGHSADMLCFMEPEDYNCLELVEITLPHCQHKRNAECYRDIKKLRCLEDCEYRLPCGHKCELKCHPNRDPEHINIRCYKLCKKIICQEHHQECINKCWQYCSICQVPVDKTLPCGHQTEAWCGLSIIICKEKCKLQLPCGHQCKKKCSEPCTTECKQMVAKNLSCGHSIKIECFLKHENIEEKSWIEEINLNKLSKKDYKCQQKCSKTLPCGHLCQNLCYEYCTVYCQQQCSKTLPCGHLCQNVCYEICTVQCKEIVTVTGLCKHDIKLECHYSKLQPEILSLLCEVPCSQLLPCEHQCSGTCGKCRQGRVHAQCLNPCGRIQICGHSCDIPCAVMCPPCTTKCGTRCSHSKCPNKCGFPCKKCKERCEWKCRHYQCNRKCGDDCDRPPCNEPCPEKLRCRHACIGLCGELCPTVCRRCHPEKLTEFILSGLEDEPDARFIQLEECGHCIEVTGLDRWMNMESHKIQMKSCPRCKTTIWNSYRYGNIIRECIRNIQTVKKRVCNALNSNRLKMRQMFSEIEQCQTIKEHFQKHCNTLMNRLSRRYTLNHVECTIIENQILLLKAMAKVKVVEYSSEVKNCMEKNIINLADRLIINEQHMSEHELNSISKELRRISLHSSLIEIDRRLTNMLQRSTSYTEMMGKIQEVKGLFDTGKQFSEQEESHCEKIVEELRRSIGLGINREEKVMIVKAMGLKQGAWYKCPNGHIYAIGECGGATEQSKCNECGAAIGGSSHRLLSTNSHAGEMDGSRVPAWPQTTDIRNYDLGNLQ